MAGGGRIPPHWRGHLIAAAVILGIFGVAALTALIIAEFSEDFSFGEGGASLVYLIALLFLVASGVLLSRQIRLSQALKAMVFWVGLALVLLLLFSFREDFAHLWERVVGEVDPGRGISGERSMRFSAATDGHFYIDAEVNGQSVRFLVDTGATHTVLARDDAGRVGIEPDRLSYSYRVETANGTVAAAPAVVERLRIGGRTIENQWVLVLRNGGRLSVLGLSTLNVFRSYEVRGDRLYLRW